MPTPQSTTLETEPTADFNRRCLEVAQRWQGGDLPFKEAIAQVEALGEEAERADHIANVARVEHLLGYMHHYHGNLDLSLRHYEQARALYQAIGNRKRMAIMDLNMGETYRYKGDFTRSRRLFHTAYETLGEVGDLSNQTLAVSNEGQVLLSMGQVDKALAALEEGDRLALQVDPHGEDETMTTLLCEVHHGLAVIHLAQGDTAKAWESARFALKLAQTGKQPMQRGFANRAAGEVISALESSPDPDLPSDPDEYFRAANEAFREIELEGELARTMFAHARSLARRGKGVTAARKLQQVMIIFVKLGMSDDAAKAAELQRRVI